MAVWVVTREESQVRLKYRDRRGTQDCGVSEAILLPDVEAFAIDQAEPFDRVLTPAGLFVRQAGPAGGLRM